LHERHGLKLLHADPSELALCDGEVCYDDDPIDLVYRDYSVLDLVSLQRKGINVEPMRTLFRQNRIVSSITAELDQKSCLEVLTAPKSPQKSFGPDGRPVFRRPVLWTRILSDRETLLPDGETGDLLEYVRREHEALVLKPNRSYGGEGVLIGPALSAAEWG